METNWYVIGGTNPGPPRILAGPFIAREDAEMAETLYRYAIDHPRDAYAAASTITQSVANAGIYSELGTGWFQRRYRASHTQLGATDGE